MFQNMKHLCLDTNVVGVAWCGIWTVNYGRRGSNPRIRRIRESKLLCSRGESKTAAMFRRQLGEGTARGGLRAGGRKTE
jgi:hypothetical protein